MKVNLDGAFFCLRAASQRLVEQGDGGALPVVTSTSAVQGPTSPWRPSFVDPVHIAKLATTRRSTTAPSRLMPPPDPPNGFPDDADPTPSRAEDLAAAVCRGLRGVLRPAGRRLRCLVRPRPEDDPLHHLHAERRPIAKRACSARPGAGDPAAAASTSPAGGWDRGRLRAPRARPEEGLRRRAPRGTQDVGPGPPPTHRGPHPRIDPTTGKDRTPQRGLSARQAKR